MANAITSHGLVSDASERIRAETFLGLEKIDESAILVSLLSRPFAPVYYEIRNSGYTPGPLFELNHGDTGSTGKEKSSYRSDSLSSCISWLRGAMDVAQVLNLVVNGKIDGKAVEINKGRNLIGKFL